MDVWVDTAVWKYVCCVNAWVGTGVWQCGGKCVDA